MIRTRFYTVIAVVLLATAFWGVYAPSALAAVRSSVDGSSQTQVQTEVLHAPAKLCDFLKKSSSELAMNPHVCDMRVVLTNTFISKKSGDPNAVFAASCPSGSLKHTASYTDLTFLWGFSQTTIFDWDGNCDTPTVSYQDCSQMWAYWPFSLSPATCSNYASGVNRVAQDNITVTESSVYQFTASIYSTADPSDTKMVDSWS